MALMKISQRNYKNHNTNINSDKHGVVSAPRCKKNFAMNPNSQLLFQSNYIFSIKLSFGKTLATIP